MIADTNFLFVVKMVLVWTDHMYDNSFGLDVNM